MHFTICKHVHLLCIHQPPTCTSDVHHSNVGLTSIESDGISQPVSVATCISSAGPGSSVPSAMGTISKEHVLKRYYELEDMLIISSG